MTRLSRMTRILRRRKVSGQWPLNNVATQDDYTDTVTAQFPVGRTSFSLQVYNAGVFYKLLSFEPPTKFDTDATEHYLAPVLADFDSPQKEGLGVGQQFGGITFRSAVAGVPARVTVI